MSKYALEVKNVSKSFRLPTEQANGIKQAFVNWTKGVKGYKEQHVLKDISFKVEKGDFFGIVGRNGSGKSTLLKIISQIYTPEKGEVKVNGTLIPFIELGVGFNPELTGRENVYMNGALLGFSREEVSKMYPEIVEFAELEEFMDQKLKNYSSGMQVRLAFSIAIKAQGDILVLDEVLAVGDEAFQRKCNDFFEKIKKDKTKTVILVTHSMDSVRKYCNKAMMIRNGKVVVYGSPSDVASQYTADNLKVEKKASEVEEGEFAPGLNETVTFFEVRTLSSDVITKKDEDLTFEIEYEVTKNLATFPSFSFHCEGMGRTIFDEHKPTKISKGAGRHTYRYSIPTANLNNGNYMVTAVLREAKDEEQIAFITSENFVRFSIARKFKGRKDNGLLNTKGKFLEIDGEKL